MVPYLGDFAEDATVYIPFNTFDSNDPSASVTITNLADADIKVHKDGSATEIVTDGATVAINFDSITGNHLITIDTSADAAYATGSDYIVRIEGTTVDAATINAFVASFSIQNRYSAGALRPTTAGRTLDVSAGGEAGLDWANIGSPTTAQNLSGTNIDTDQVVASVSGAVGSVTGAVASVTAGVTLANGAVTNASLAGNMEIVFETDFATNYNTTDNAWVTNGTTFIGTGWNTGKTGYSLTQSFPTNFADLAISVTTGQVTVGTNNDKTGYTVSTVSDKTGYSLAADQSAVTIGTVTTNTDMRGTDSAALASVCTEVRLAELDAANLPADVDNILTDTGTTIPGTITTLQADVTQLQEGIIYGTCGSTDLATTTCSSNLTGYTNDQLIGRVIIFTSGPADGEATDITDYVATNGVLTFTALTLAPENNNTFKIV